MRERRINTVLTWLLLLPVFSLQFGYVPGWDAAAEAGKLVVFALPALTAAALLLRRPVLRLPRIATWAGLFLLLLAVSALAARQPYAALLPVATLAVGLFFVAVVIRLAGESDAFARRFFDALLGLGVLGAAIGLYQYCDVAVSLDPHHVFVRYLIPASWGARITGIYAQPNHFALLMTLCLLGFFYRYLHTPLAFSRPWLAPLRFVPVWLVALAFFLTESRNGLVSLTCILALLGYLAVKGRYCPRGSAERRQFLRLLLCLGLAWGTFWLLTRWAPSGLVGLMPDAESRAGSDDGRWGLYTSALLIFFDHPWLGVGLDHFKLYLGGYQPLSHDLLGFVEYEAMGYSRWAHNELLQLLCEGGIGAFLLAAGLIAAFARGLYRRVLRPGGSPEPFLLYSHLLLLPFLLQSIFSWPLRFPPLLFLFWIFVGLLLTQYPLRDVPLSGGFRRTVAALLLGALLVLGILVRLETRLGAFLAAESGETLSSEGVAEFEALFANPYSKFRVMWRVLPWYNHMAFTTKDAALARRLLPIAEEAARMQGTGWQYYGLALLYETLGREGAARAAVERALELKPMEQAYWNYLHHLNVLQASRETGLPVESFLPLGGQTQPGSFVPPEL